MTIQEAIKSGKAFKRRYLANWIIYDPKKESRSTFEESTKVWVAFSAEDILADDWEVREE
jgi:hypothetical protein